MRRRIAATLFLLLVPVAAGAAPAGEAGAAGEEPAEVAFSLPRGYTDGEGTVHRSGAIRPATRQDYVAVGQDPRAQANWVYADVLLLSRLIVRLGAVEQIGPEVVEGLWASDFRYLLRLADRIEAGGQGEVTLTCSACQASFTAPLTGAERTDGASPVPFTLPGGYTDGAGKVHRQGELRLATVLDEVASAAGERAQKNPRYREVVVLSRLITRLGELKKVDAEIVGQLAFRDFSHLRAVYRQHNEPAGSVEVVCPHCGAAHEVGLARP